jgi:peptide/nickel transport system permease protein
MADLLARRLATLLLTLWAASILVFVVLEILPGDPAMLVLGTEVREDTLAALRAAMGLDRPAIVRYFAWIGGMLTGDFGISYTYKIPVAQLIGERMAVTLPLAILAVLLSTALAMPLGILAAARRARTADWAVMAGSQVGLAVPNFWLGILLILAFALQLGLFPAGGFPGWSAGLGPALGALVLPMVSLALTEAAILARVVRSAFLETMSEDWVRTARAKGLTGRAILFRHVLRNALVPIATLIGLQFSFLLAGTVVIENVFALPGLGRLAFQAIAQRDLIVIETVVLLLAAIVVVVNFVVDLLQLAIDPRPRAAR